VSKQRPLSKISTRGDLAKLLGVGLQDLTYITNKRGPESYYSTFYIQKRGSSGGQRRIDAPRSTVYHFQKQLASIFDEYYVAGGSVHGFVSGKSIKSNAQAHQRQQVLLNIDIADFFHSIHFGRVRGLLESQAFGLSRDVAGLIAHLCCYNNALPMGAPTSPVLSNMVCRGLDRELERLARRFGCHYTRYADDMTLSTKSKMLPEEIAFVNEHGEARVGQRIAAAIEINGFQVNSAKTRIRLRDDRRAVTGLIINEKVNVDRRYIRRIRAMLHSWETLGLVGAQARMVQSISQQDRFPGKDLWFLDVLWGRISFVAMIRGYDDDLVQSLIHQFGNLNSGKQRLDGLPDVLERRPTSHRGISDSTFETVLDVLDRGGDALSRTPATAQQLDEEDIRNLLLVPLAALPTLSATGETFNRGGKTDIQVRRDGRVAFIAECKIWDGPAKITQALDQLLSYLSWPDTKAALIVFNKTISMSHLLATIPRVVEAHPRFVRGIKGRGSSRSRFVVSNQLDKAQEITLAILVMDLRP
jgi:RNA-directed DNA polymerase